MISIFFARRGSILQSPGKACKSNSFMSKLGAYYEGTSEVQRMVISSWMGIK